jgi:hypothetical protein
MPVAHDPEHRFLRVTLEGTVTTDVITAEFLAMLEHPAFRPGANALWDFRAASLDGISVDDVRRIAALVEAYRDERGPGKVALVMEGDAAYGLGRMYEAYAGRGPTVVQVFRSVAAAEAWLGEPF